jgi:hypothetical protein
VKEEERYDLSVRALDREGAPGSGYVVLFDFRTPWPTILQLDPETGAAQTQRLAPGPYNLSTWMTVRGSSGPDSTGIALLAEPHFVLGRDQEVLLDARKAKRITVTTPRPSENRHRRMQFFHDAGIPDGFSFMDLYFVPPNVDDMYALPTGTVAGRRSTSPPGGAVVRRSWTCPPTSPRRRTSTSCTRAGRAASTARCSSRGSTRAPEPRPSTREWTRAARPW